VDQSAGVPGISQRLVDEFGHLLPDTLITRTVEAAATVPPAYPDEPDLQDRARADVHALAEAAQRSASRDGGRLHGEPAQSAGIVTATLPEAPPSARR
jgi:hypothetical protein